MDSLSPQVVFAAKLPILNPNEFDLWKMRIEQYFLMTDYSLWEVILNGDSPMPTRLVEGTMEIGPDIKNMTLNEYFEYKAEKERQSWRNVRSKSSPTRIRAKNLRRIGQEKGVDLEKEEAQVEDDGDTYDIWDIMVEDVELIRQFLMPNVSDEIDEVIQPFIPEPIHTTLPNDDYVALATKLILDELLEEFRDEILNVTMVDEEAEFNLTKDIEELGRLFTKDPQSHFTKIHVPSVITKPELFIHTQPMSPLYRIFESYESSTKP
uniref:DUF4219 domain-containing protein/UBN2 domain-containing protein n=1 Tax=Tanacetum cinerariifolium TaxID=118510 RepID=A0A6L2JWD4_TANCI|nr:DUF4219 domain-containing protein/UBN2 domain-containing protein [Tanacetum cinerariifolium]